MTRRHIISKLQKIKDKEKILKEAREKYTPSIQMNKEENYSGLIRNLNKNRMEGNV